MEFKRQNISSFCSELSYKSVATQHFHFILYILGRHVNDVQLSQH